MRLKIKDLRFHDLRNEATTRLFEAGYPIEQVALVTGHKDWKILKRYTNLRPEQMHRMRPPTSNPLVLERRAIAVSEIAAKLATDLTVFVEDRKMLTAISDQPHAENELSALRTTP